MMEREREGRGRGEAGRRGECSRQKARDRVRMGGRCVCVGGECLREQVKKRKEKWKILAEEETGDMDRQ